MREMTEATYDAIKNRAMKGVNGFRYEVEVEGYTDGYGEIEQKGSNNLGTAWAVDYTIRRDGKVLIAYLSGLNLYLKVVDSENDFNTSSIQLNDGVLFYTFASIELPMCFGLTRLNNGKILMVIDDIGKFGGSPWEIKIFMSESGSGEDFQLKKTVFSSPRSDSLQDYCNAIVPKPAQGDDGRIFVGASVRVSYLGYDMFESRMLISDDEFDTFSIISVPGVDNTRRLYVQGPSEIVTIGDFIFYGLQFLYGGAYRCVVYSNDNGNTWTWTTSGMTGLIPQSGENATTLFTKDKSGLLFALISTSLYQAEASNTTDYSKLNDPANWTLVRSDFNVGSYRFGMLSNSDRGDIRLFYVSAINDNPGTVLNVYLTRTKKEPVFDFQSITISKSKGGANTSSLKVNNKGGVVNPRNVDGRLYGILNLNRKVMIRQGYGEDLVPSFAGIIDGIHMSTFPQIAELKLRDNLKRALDQTVTKNGSQVVNYPHQPIESIVADLCNLCELPVGTIEPTGISIEKEFNWQTYADAIQFLSDIASFEFLVDESGLFHFRRDYQPNDMEIAWSFEEGVDIQNLSYEVDDTDIYKSVRVYGKSGDNVLVYNAPFVDAEEFNILPQKIMKIDATEASTTTELRKIAERATATMRSRTRVIRFSAIAIPHLQVGDFIQLFESSTNTHEIYRLSSINLTMTKDNFTMDCTAYYYGDSIVPGELPEDTANQTPDPTLNLIPNMTSNTTPSGVASSSSTYLLYGVRYSPWRAFNNDDTDYFWDLSTKTGWIAYEFTEKTIVDKYVIKARQDLVWNKALPKDWIFQGFDGATWVDLDARTNQTAWGIYEERSFTFINTTPYPKYRLKVSANNGYVRTQIEQLSMYYGGGL